MDHRTGLMKYLSMQPVTKISVFGIRLAIFVLALYWIAIFAGTHLPAAIDFSPRVSDKLKHFGAFFLLASLLCYSTNSKRWLVRFGSIALICMVYGAIDEWSQQFVPGRFADPKDFLSDCAGVLTAVLLYVACKLCYERLIANRLHLRDLR